MEVKKISLYTYQSLKFESLYGYPNKMKRLVRMSEQLRPLATQGELAPRKSEACKHAWIHC